MTSIPGQYDIGYLELIRSRGSNPASSFPPIKDDKLIGKAFVGELGIRTIPEIRLFDSIESVNLDGISGRFVLKPTFLSTSHGVFLLKSTEKPGIFFDERYQKERSIDEIRDELHRRSDASEYNIKRWVVEERIIDALGNVVPEDVKFFCFYGEIGLIQVTQRAKSLNRVAYFDGEFNRLPASSQESGIRVNPSIVSLAPLFPPPHAADLLSVARRVSAALPTPFVRVDLYDTSAGPTFGEFTFTPGTFFYEDREVMDASLSVKLGKLWRCAENRILSDPDPNQELNEALGILYAGQAPVPITVRLRTGSFAKEKTPMAAICTYRGSDPSEVRDSLYDVPIKRFFSLAEVSIDPNEAARYIVHESYDPLPLDFLVYPRKSRRLLVGLHGAEFRQEANLPKFEFVRSFLGREESLLFLSDSTLLHDDTINLGWMVGTADNHLIPRYTRIVAKVQEALRVERCVLVGHSAGGFTAIAIGSQLPGSYALSVNGQTVIEKYEPWTLRQLRKSVFPEVTTDQEMITAYPDRLDLRRILDDRAEGTSFAYFAHADDPNTMSRLPMFPELAEHLGVDPQAGGLTEAGDVMAVCRWQTAPNVSASALPGTVLPFIDAILGLPTEFDFGTSTPLALASRI